ncbi:hypothetical protein [Streptomyces sp. NPDC054797]
MPLTDNADNAPFVEEAMAEHHGPHVLAAAALTAALTAAATVGVLAWRWRFTRARRDTGHGASTARAPWRRTAPTPAAAEAGRQRVVTLHAAYLDQAGDQALKTADAHLDRYWASIAPLYPRSTPGRAQG